MFVRTCSYFVFHTSSSNKILTKNQLEGQFHTLAASLMSNFDRVVEFCGTNSYLFFTPHRVMRFLQRISLKVSHTPAVSIKLLSSEEPTSYPIFRTLPSGEILTKSQLEGQSFHTLPSGEILTKSQLEGQSFHTLPSGEILTKSQLEGQSFHTLPRGEILTKNQLGGHVLHLIQCLDSYNESARRSIFTPSQAGRFHQGIGLKVNFYVERSIIFGI